MSDVFEVFNPGKIQLNTLDRPGVVSTIHSASLRELEEISKYFKPLAVEIISAAPDRKRLPSYRDDIESAILGTLSRRPCTLEDLAIILSSHINELSKYLGTLEEAGKIESFLQERGFF